MIRIDEVAKKIENILNGTDQEVAAILAAQGVTTLPTTFAYRVQTEGYHLESIADVKTGQNFIPVFISSMGGNFNPVPELLQANYVIPIAFYFPVRFKEQMFAMNEYLARAFVGQQLNYGTNSGRALSNISVAQFGEITDLDLKQFEKWVETTYKRRIEVMEPFIQMSITLYLSTASADLVYGNDATATLTITGVSTDTLSTEDATETLSFVQSSVQSHSDPNVQQLIGTNESEGVPSGTSYASSFSVYIKNNNFFKYLIGQWLSGNAQTLSLSLSLSFLGQTYNPNVYIQSVNLVVQKGELATMTFAFGKKAVIQDGGL